LSKEYKGPRRRKFSIPKTAVHNGHGEKSGNLKKDEKKCLRRKKVQVAAEKHGKRPKRDGGKKRLGKRRSQLRGGHNVLRGVERTCSCPSEDAERKKRTTANVAQNQTGEKEKEEANQKAPLEKGKEAIRRKGGESGEESSQTKKLGLEGKKKVGPYSEEKKNRLARKKIA